MKKTLLLLTGLLMGLTTVSATNAKDHDVGVKDVLMNRNHFAQPIMFVERGIEFMIFPDGSFDFDTNFYDPYYNDNMYYRSNTRRNGINVNYHGPNVSIGFSSNNNRGVYVSRDRNGLVRRVGNVNINYNWYGQVSRIGSVFIDYSRGRNSTLARVGGLRVNYNAWGEIVNVRGNVNGFNDGYCNINGWITSNNQRFDQNHRRNSDWYDGDYDDDYYYYKSNGKVKKQKKMKR